MTRLRNIPLLTVECEKVIIDKAKKDILSENLYNNI